MTSRVAVNFISHVACCLQEEEPQVAYPMFIAWAPHIAHHDMSCLQDDEPYPVNQALMNQYLLFSWKQLLPCLTVLITINLFFFRWCYNTCREVEAAMISVSAQETHLKILKPLQMLKQQFHSLSAPRAQPSQDVNIAA